MLAHTQPNTLSLALASSFFILFFSHLRGIISLFNPFPYIKWCFLLHLASSTYCTSCWQHNCLPPKAPSQPRQGDGKEGQTDPSGTSWKISSFFVSPLRRQASFSAFVRGMSLNKTSKFCRHSCLWSWAISSNKSDEGAFHRFWEFHGGWWSVNSRSVWWIYTYIHIYILYM